MRHFLMQYSEYKGRNDYAVKKTVRIWRIIRNEPRFVGEMTETFVDQFQLFMMCAQKYKAMPRAAFVENQFGGYKYCNKSSIKDAGFATVHEI